MKKPSKKMILALRDIRNEDKKIIELFKSLSLSSEHRVLDIGCGNGSKIRLLQSMNIEAVGVDTNPALVLKNKRAGLNCMTVEEFSQTTDQYDVLLMSHIIEHFQPQHLLEFMDSYLDRLKPNGHLMIVTPLESPYFYDDFDHVKPYHPVGIDMVFGGKNAQVQYYSRNRLELQDLWFRKEPLRLTFFSGLYLDKYSRFPRLINLLFALSFRLSLGVISRTNGWIGLYRKMSNETS